MIYDQPTSKRQRRAVEHGFNPLAAELDDAFGGSMSDAVAEGQSQQDNFEKTMVFQGLCF